LPVFWLQTFNLWLVILVSTAGNILGSFIIFYIGKTGGRWFLERYGKYVLVHDKDLDIGDTWFSKYGSRAVFWGRMVPAVRSFISLPAGIANMNLYKFLSFSFAGAFLWTTLMAYIGFKTGDKLHLIEKYMDRFEILGSAILIVGAIWYINWHRKRN
jgi:membrane protein DedA with SNARE-associated domain